MPAHYISCHSCGLELRLPPLKPGKAAFCPRCGHPLARVEANPFLLPPALALASLIMLAVVFSGLYMHVTVLGLEVKVHFGPAFYLMFVLSVLLIRTALSVPEHWVYYQIRWLRGDKDLVRPEGGSVFCGKCLFERPAHETECEICGSGLHKRRPNSLSLSLALLITAMILLLPANLMTIMVSSNPTVIERSTIFSGIQFMWRDGDHYIAMIIFSASIMVPWLKIIAMGVLLYAAKFGTRMAPQKLSKLYLLTESIGRWSMIDIFVIIMLMSTFRTHMARVVPGPAALYFCLVVLLTMLSAHFFDPRLMWDKAAQRNKKAT